MEKVDPNSWCVVLNPESGNGFVRAKKSKILFALKELIDPYQIVYTEYPKHEESIVKKSIQIGFRKFISVGGDGTLHNVVNGVMKHGGEFVKTIQIAVIPVGTGNDWARNYSIPKQITHSIRVINEGNLKFQDIGKITSTKQIVYFNNLAGLGFDGYVVNSLSKFKKFGGLSYFLSALDGLFRYQSQELILHIEDREMSIKSFLLAIGICKFCGGGMRLTDESNPSDGLMDVTLIKELSRISFIRHIRKMYNGKIARHKKVEIYKVNQFSVTIPSDSELFMQADGELIGSDGFRVETIPAAISFVVNEKK